MVKVFPAVLLGCTLLSGCATRSGAGSSSTVSTLESLYLATAAAALTYEALPSADPAVVARIKGDENAAFAALQVLQSAVQGGQSPDATALAAVQAVIAALQAAVPMPAAPTAAAQGGAK